MSWLPVHASETSVTEPGSRLRSAALHSMNVVRNPGLTMMTREHQFGQQVRDQQTVCNMTFRCVTSRFKNQQGTSNAFCCEPCSWCKMFLCVVLYTDLTDPRSFGMLTYMFHAASRSSTNGHSHLQFIMFLC